MLPELKELSNEIVSESDQSKESSSDLGQNNQLVMTFELMKNKFDQLQAMLDEQSYILYQTIKKESIDFRSQGVSANFHVLKMSNRFYQQMPNFGLNVDEDNLIENKAQNHRIKFHYLDDQETFLLK